MLSTENHHPSSEPESGSIEVRTETGHVLSIFALSAKDFARLKPDEEVYREVAAMRAASKLQLELDSDSEGDSQLNTQRAPQLVQG